MSGSIDGLMVVLDACHSGAVVLDPVPGLLRSGVHARLEFLAATRPEDVASHGCFSRSLIERLTRGSSTSAEPELRAYDEHDRLSEVAPAGCQVMAPVVHVSVNGSADAGLWLGRNQAADLRPTIAGTASADRVARLIRNWQPRLQPTARLMGMWAEGRSPIAVTGTAGTGKSALLASLGRRSAGDFGLDAFVSLRPGDTLDLLADRLVEQLDHTVAYRTAVAAWQDATPVQIQESLPAFDRRIRGPLGQDGPADQLRIGIDTADQLDTVQLRRLIETCHDLPNASFVLTGRHSTRSLTRRPCTPGRRPGGRTPIHQRGDHRPLPA